MFSQFVEFDLFTMTVHETMADPQPLSVDEFFTYAGDYRSLQSSTKDKKTMPRATRNSPRSLFFSFDIDYKYRDKWMELGFYPDVFRGHGYGVGFVLFFSLSSCVIFKDGTYQTVTVGDQLISTVFCDTRHIGDLASRVENKIRSGDTSDLDGTVVLEYDV